MVRHILKSDLQNLSSNQIEMIEKGMIKGLGAIGLKDNNPMWFCGISEAITGTGEVWLCPIEIIGHREWQEIKNFYFWARDAWGFKRIQSYVHPDTPKGTLTMFNHVNIKFEVNLKNWYNGLDTQIWSWVR